MLYNSVTVRLNEMSQEGFLSPLYNFFIEGLAAILQCRKENIYIFNILDDTDVDARILNVSFSVKKSDNPDDYFYSPQYLMEKVYLNRAILAKLSTVKVLPFDDNLCVREPCPYFEECMSVLKFGNASGFISSNTILFRPIYPVNTFACTCPLGFTGMQKHYLCDSEVNLCYSNPCGQNGTCVQREGGYTCVCKEGFTGKNCEVDMNDGSCSVNVCRGNSNCAKLIQGGFICENCQFYSFNTRLCELTARRFVQGSFLTFPALRQRHRLNIKLSFATRSKNALLLYNGRYNEKHDFIALEIMNGDLQFSFSLGTEVSRVKTSIPNGVSDGEWHTLQILYYNRTATLSLDECDSIVAIMFGHELGDYNCANVTTHILEPRCSDPTSTCHRFLDLTGPLQLGGLPSVPSDFQVIHQDYDGCLKDFYIDNQFVDLNAHVADNGTMTGCPERRQFCVHHPCKNGGTCREVWGRFLCNCPKGYGGKDCSEGIEPQKYFIGQSFLIFHSNVRVIQLPWSTNLSFRTWQVDSLLMRIQIGQSGEAVLELVNGHVRYRVNAEWLVLDQVKISDGQWHNVEVKWTTDGVWLTLDYGNYEKVGVFDSQVAGQYLGKVVVGGIESSEPNNNPLNFKGCLKDIRVGNRTSSWLRPVDEKNVQEGCPVVNSCLSNPCPMSSKCVDIFGVPKCTCLPGYFGDHCTDICRHNPCLNGGTCRRTKTKSGYTCYCNAQHGGTHCQEEVNQYCPTNWYGAPICGPCKCEVDRGYDADCNKTTGECYCKENHYRPVDDEICYDCNCYLTGSFSKQCNSITGQCKCRSGVIGRRCHSCSNPFAEVTLRGCEVIYDACPRSFSNGIWWERTYFGKKAIQNCPNKLQGKAERFCDAENGWEETNLFNCTSSAFADLRDLLDNLENKQLDMNTYLSVKISQDLLASTESTENLHGDDLFVTIRLITMVLTYESSQEGLNLTHMQDKDFIQNIVKTTSRILLVKYKEYWDQLYELNGGAVNLVLQKFEEYGKVLANSQKDTFTRPFEITSENMVFGLDTISLMEIRGISLQNSVPSTHHPSFIDFSFPSDDQPSIVMPKYTNYPQKYNSTGSDVSVVIPLSVLGIKYKTTPGVYSGESAKDSAVVSYTIYKTLGDLLPRKYHSDVRIRWGTGLAVATPIVSLNVKGAKKSSHSLPKSIRLAFKLVNKHHQMNPQCVYWKEDSSRQGRWAIEGCETLIIVDRTLNSTAVNCTCNHLSSFAVLIDLKDEEFVVKETVAESVVSYTCVISSLVLLFVAFIVFCALHGLQTNSNTIHKNMTICIFVTELVFLVALKLRSDLIHKEFPCKIIAIFLHYFFLCEFSWVLLEAVHLYRMLTELRDINHGQMRFYYTLGYGIPAIIVGLSVGVRADGYGNHIFCWLSIYETVIWSLVGPICCYVVINLLVFVLAIRASLQLKDEVEDFGSLRVLLWLGIALLPLMGAAWILAMLAVNENVDLLYYFFEIFSLLQGLYVFLGYCVFNEKVRLQTVRTFRRLMGKKLPYEDNEVRNVNSGPNKKSALAYHNRSFDVLHRTIGISTSSTTSRSTCKTSSSPYHTDSHFRNTSTSTPSNSFSHFGGKPVEPRSHLKNKRHKFDGDQRFTSKN
uniref:Cadherin EGF LAG seven-pass G-type receptor 1 n=1 Tax=Strigamia maritima TaxID=126957 RepID=T1IKX4_STRMM